MASSALPLQQRIKPDPVPDLSGNVTIETDTFLLHAEQADLNVDTQEILPRGDVHIRVE
jgi:lipopolysaccharide assembly outer membrane protein LptD (OstA)